MISYYEALNIEVPTIEDSQGRWWVSAVAYRKAIDTIYEVNKEDETTTLDDTLGELPDD